MKDLASWELMAAGLLFFVEQEGGSLLENVEGALGRKDEEAAQELPEPPVTLEPHSLNSHKLEYAR